MLLCVVPEVDVPTKEEDAGAAYWQSEHHRFDYSDNMGALLEVVPLSYHLMGLAVPGTFVQDRKYSYTHIHLYTCQLNR